MSISLNKITSKADCDLVIQMATEEKEELLHRKSVLEYQQSNFDETADEINASVTAVNAELAVLDNLVGNLPEGDTKDANLVRKKRLELKSFILKNKQSNYNAVAQIERELELEKITSYLALVDALITAANNRKAEIA